MANILVFHLSKIFILQADHSFSETTFTLWIQGMILDNLGKRLRDITVFAYHSVFVRSVAAGVERRDLQQRGAEAARVLRAQRAALPRPAAATPPGGGAQEDEAASHLRPGGQHT